MSYFYNAFSVNTESKASLVCYDCEMKYNKQAEHTLISIFCGKLEIIVLLLDEQWQIFIEVPKIKSRPQMSSELKPQTA